jgi:serine/threonine protein kinase
VLGEGGFGATYRAVDGATGQRVVLKRPHLTVAGDLAAYNRYQREIDIGGRHRRRPSRSGASAAMRRPTCLRWACCCTSC